MRTSAFRTTIGLLALAKAVDVARVAPLWLVAPLVVAGLGVLVVDRDAYLWLLAASALAINLSPVYWNHLALLMWASLALVIFRQRVQRNFVLKCQLSIMYAFASLAKLWPDWVSGDVLRETSWLAPLLPSWAVMAAVWLNILAEGLLAWGVWQKSAAWFWIAVGLHGSFVLFITPEPTEMFRLVIFGTLTLAMWLHVRGGPAVVTESGASDLTAPSGPSVGYGAG